MHAAPLNYLQASGERAHTILPLTWYTLAVSIVVCVVIALLLLGAVRRSRLRGGPLETRSLPVERGGNGLRWIGIGLAISAVPLLISLVWTMVALAKIAGPPSEAPLTIDITAHQWWWEGKYASTTPSEAFTVANEFHIPVGTRVRVRLQARDVIHSFWVPQLSGKTDLIPGQTNMSWLEASAPGRYLGQCGEFCGYQHAHMQFEVVADPPEEFERWRRGQLGVAPDPADEAEQRGRTLVEYRCGLCHRVRGTTAGAVVAPDLTHVASRRMLAAGALANNRGNLAGWIENPQAVKPRTLMPNQGLSAAELNDVVAYLETLQ